MKSKILKILGIALTLMLVFSLGAVFSVAPVAASPDEDEWSTYDLPDADEDGDYFWDASIVGGPGPIARDIDGYFWAYVDIGTPAVDEVVKSTDTEGRAWEVTMYSDADDGVEGDVVVAIACSPEDEDVVYVADAAEVYKTEDGGDTWEQVGSSVDFNSEPITCLDVGYVDDEPYVYIGTEEGTPSGDVYYIQDVAFGGGWTDLNVITDVDDLLGQEADEYERSDVYGIACSPDFDNDALVAAVVASDDDGIGTNVGSFVVVNRGADIGTWTDVEIGTNIVITEAADPAFVDDFDEDDAYEFFVGVCVGTTDAGVYRIDGETDVDDIDPLDDVVDVAIISLDLVGNQGNTYLLAGAEATGVAADVWYSDDDGVSWLQASAEGINPAGEGPTYVICDEDIADDGLGWAATAGTGAGIHLTLTGGESWVGISLMDTDANALVDIGPSPDWASDDTMFVLYTNTAVATEMLRYDGTNWERIWEETQYSTTLGAPCTGTLDMVDASPEFGDDETLFAAETTSPEVFVSEDGGTVFADTRNVPTTLASWAIVDGETIIAGGTDSNVYITDRQGTRAWDKYEVTATASQTISSLAVWGDTVICGTDGSEVFISEDFAETWDIVGAALDVTLAGNTYVGFDTDFATTNTIYAASDNVIARFLDVGELAEDWEGFTEIDGVPTDISGLAVADGCVYVSDAAAADGTTVGSEVGAVQRTVDPLDDVDDVEETEFDFMAEGLDADGSAEVFDLLYLSEGSTILWAVDTTAAASVIYTIEDLLVGPTSGGVADPGTTDFTLEWDGFDNATDYDVAVYSDEAMRATYECYDAPTEDDDPVLIVDADDGDSFTGSAPEAGTTYWWQVRATEPVNSKWSEVWEFTTLPATMTIDADQFGPAIGATNVPLMPSFGWQLIEEADEYMFELADNPDFTTPIVSTATTNPVFQLDAALAYSTNYFWRVKAVSGTAESNWATGTFTTMAAPVEAPVPPPPAEAPTLTIPPAQQIAPNYIYAIIGIGAALAVVVIVLIVRTRKP